MILFAILLTIGISLIFGLLPATIQRRRAAGRDFGWAAGIWLVVWVYALCAYHRPGLTVGFDLFRLAAITAMTGWAGICAAGLRIFGHRGARYVLPLLVVLAAGAELFVGNVTYFNTHSYEPFQLMDYLDPNVNVGRGNGTYTLDEDRTYLRFLEVGQPIYNLHLDNLTNDDTDPLHADSTFTLTIEGTDEANGALIRFGSWEVAPQAGRTHTISLDLTGRVGTLTLQASGYSSDHAQYPVAFTVTGITANMPRPLQLSLLRFVVLWMIFGALYLLRPGSGLWQRRWLAGNVCDRAAAVVLGLILAGFVVVVPFWQPGNTGLATATYNTAYWDGESTVSFVYQQYGALAHSLLNGRLDLEEDPPAALVEMENPYDAAARDALQIQGGRWDHAFYNGRYYVYFGIVPCLLFQLPFEAITGIQNLAYAPCMVILGLVFLLSCFGVLSQVVRRWFPQASTAAYLICVAALVLGSQLYSLLVRPYIYEYTIVCGAALLMLGLWLWFAAAATPVSRGGLLTLRLTLGSLCVALVAGCRPQMEVFALLALPIFWNRYIARRRLHSGAGVREAVAFLLPVLVVAAGLMWYNYARFESPFDFGANYNITGNDMTKRGFNVVRIGPAIFTSLLDLPRLKSVFPYLQETDVTTNAVIRTISEKFCGGMLGATPFTWALLLPVIPLARRGLHRRRGAAAVVYGSVAAMLLITVLDCQMAGVLYRYLMDYSPVLLLGAALCWLLAETTLARRADGGENLAVSLLPVLRIGMAATLAWSVFYRFCTLFAMEPWLQGMNPSLYYTVNRLVQFWM
ncbi:hypothetical protein [Subdoligranulum variabile]|uniref:Uncharacterized protein n=1 Tax=Subdoligranulum variabile DSM 15176 TaxID=411471 RepID=D1PJM5_9FIRM|nr:hypothetical protein [Subdoligranulum variabile]EFB76973.1 hypothetical protein SUBVAR_04595 [Subdoligranulum variabile DSM 15176]UWP67641.1 hypothetical protein NQ490_11930 [Subdoligranulum variabile]